MTTTGVADDTVDRASVSAGLAPALGRLAEAARESATVQLSHWADGWIRRLEEYAASQGATERAGFEGLKAHLLGKNPVWAALKGAWLGASVPLRVAAVLVVVLLLVTSPVALLVLILGLLVAAIVAAVRAATR